MNPEIKTKWLEALRSDRYAQGHATLRTKDDRFCCLGVLCDVVKPDAWGKSDFSNSLAHDRNGIAFPGDQIYAAAGLEYNLGTTLAAMNDQGDSFADIADYIEEHA